MESADCMRNDRKCTQICSALVLFFWLVCAPFFDSLKPVLDSGFNHFGFGADEAQGRIAYCFTILRARRLFEGFWREFFVGGFWNAPDACAANKLYLQSDAN
ncbi:MAG TPA: hypothetical protein C5S51_02000 [Methanosarcinaceae archaeon]|nr:hypothetical protein [Methanosarcinaceae archaeon]